MFRTLRQRLLILTATVVCTTTLVVPALRADDSTGLKKIGQIKTRSANEIKSSNWSVGAETMDRDYTVYEHWKKYLGPLGVKKARLQSGWAKTEKKLGEYDWAWLDAIVNDMVDQGVEPWMCVCYGNPLYEGGGGTGLGGGLIHGKEALAAWDRYVAALVERYKGQIDEWEIWNEPALHKKQDNSNTYADLLMRTASTIKKHQPNARILGFGMAGIKLDWVKKVLDIVQKENKLGLIDELTYHPYSFNPDASYGAVLRLRKLVQSYDPRIIIRQGENGAPSKPGSFGALSKHDWTETSQAKWALRRLLGDWGRDIPTSYFAICDMQYPSRRNFKGLLAIHDDKTVDRPKEAYAAVQHLTAIFDDTVQRIKDFDADITAGREAKHYTVFGYNAPKGTIVTLWRSSDTPGKKPDVETAIVTLKNTTLKNPVWVDLRTGDVCAIDASNVKTTSGYVTIHGVPVYDSVILLAERDAIPMR